MDDKIIFRMSCTDRKRCVYGKQKKERGPCAAFIKGHGERGGGGSVAVDGGGSLVYSPLNNLKC